MNKRTILPVIALSAALVAVALPDPPLPPTLNPLGAVTLAWNKSVSDTNPAVPLNYVLEQGNISGAYLSSTNVERIYPRPSPGWLPAPITLRWWR